MFKNIHTNIFLNLSFFVLLATSSEAQNDEQTGACAHCHLNWAIKPERHYEVKVGAELTIECAASGNPGPEIVWYKNNVRIYNVSSDLDLLATSSMTKGKLHFPIITRDDYGSYSCQVNNTFNHLRRDFVISVKPRFGPDSRVEKYASKNVIYELAAKPNIQSWTHTTLASIGSPVRLRCRTNAAPDSKIYWVDSDGVIIHKFKAYQKLKSGDLIVKNVTWSDIGSYFCIVKNIFGKDKVESFLYPVDFVQKTSFDGRSA